MTRKTKIIATIGPSTSSKEMLKRIIQRGVNVCRLNFSHIEHEKAKEIISFIKEINQVTCSHRHFSRLTRTKNKNRRTKQSS